MITKRKENKNTRVAGKQMVEIEKKLKKKRKINQILLKIKTSKGAERNRSMHRRYTDSK